METVFSTKKMIILPRSIPKANDHGTPIQSHFLGIGPATSNLNTMKTKHYLELQDLKTIAAACENHALQHHWAVSIAIVDDGGHLLWMQRLDGAPAFSAHMAPAKAHTAAMGRRETKMYEDVINNGRYAFLSAPEIKGMLEGGVPIIKDGQVIGAVGVSGVKSNEDVEIAKAGIAALG